MSDPYVPAGCTSDGRRIPFGFHRGRFVEEDEELKAECSACRRTSFVNNMEFYVVGGGKIKVYCRECERDVDFRGYYHGRGDRIED